MYLKCLGGRWRFLKHNKASLETVPVWQQGCIRNVAQGMGLTVKWENQLARIKVAEPCLPDERSVERRDLVLDFKELRVLSECQQKVKQT